jgi:glycosyltransferase involved in cell wall biosynthesis
MTGGGRPSERPPRVLMVAEAATSHTHTWAAYFVQQGYAVTVVSQSRGEIDGAETIQFPPDGTWWSRLPRARFGGGWQRWVAGWPYWRRILRAVDPDIVHVHFVPGEARDYFYYRACRRLVVSTYGSDVVFEADAPPPAHTVRRITSLLKQAACVTATSQFLQKETRRFLADRLPIRVVPFGVDCDRFKPERRSVSHGSGIVLGFVKTLSPSYGPDILLEAFAAIHSQRPSTRLILAGAGPMASSLRARSVELGLGESVDFVGRVPHRDVPRLMQRLDLFVMPSVVRESFGVAALEASACGVPVVASAVGGVPEVVLHGRTGVLIPPRDADALATACIGLIDQPSIRESMGAAGRRYVLSRYDWRNTAAQMRMMYESLLVSGRTVA